MDGYMIDICIAEFGIRHKGKNKKFERGMTNVILASTTDKENVSYKGCWKFVWECFAYYGFN